jgi:hypothetical protein
MILIYAFSNPWGTNISHRTLIELQKIISHPEIIFLTINSYPQEFFRKHIQGCLPCQGEVAEGRRGLSLIIGLGDGSKFGDKIRIETQAKNAYNDKEIYPFSPIFLDINLPNVDIYNSQYFQISSNMGTYNCNWIAYKTQLYLNQHSPQTQHLFLHLPQKSNALLLARNIANLFNDNQMLK